MSENNSVREWIANSLIMDIMERNYNKIADQVADYGYVKQQVGDGARARR